MTTDDEMAVLLGRAERERRRRVRLREFPAFGPWLEARCPGWSWNWRWQRHVQAHYDAITAGVVGKLMVFLPPRHGKSEMGTVRYPVYRMERDPTTRVMVTAYGQTLAEKFSRKARRVARAAGIALSTDRTSAEDWETAAGGGLRAAGVGGAVTGMGANLIFIDDPVKSRKQANSLAYRNEAWDWYCEDVYTRREPGGAIVLQMTRYHEDDLAGRILASDDGPNWTVVKLPALAEENDPLGRRPGEALCPERFDERELAEIAVVLGHNFSALFQQRPTAREGTFFRRDWFDHRVETCPDLVSSRWRAWDMAASQDAGDWTAGARLSRTPDGVFWFEHMARFRLEPTRRDAKVLDVARADPRNTRFRMEQEPGSAGVGAGQAFVRLLAGLPASFAPSTGSKEVRAESLASQLGAGNVRVVRGPWVPAMIAEFCDFPNGANDDQVDAGASAFNLCAAGRKWETS